MNPNFEKYIHQSLKNQEEFVDAESIWEQVEPHVQPEKKRRRFFWWFFFGASVAVLTMGLWGYSQEDLPLLGERVTEAEMGNSLEKAQPSLVETEEGSINENTNKKENTKGKSLELSQQV